MSNTVPETTGLSPEGVISQLRSMRSQMEEVTPLTQEQRNLLKRRIRTHAKPVVEASINVIGVLANVSQAIGQPLDDVRRLQDDSLRWEAAADEARAFLKGIEGGNLVRRQRLTIIATQAYSIGSQLAKDPEKAVLVPHVEEVKRLKDASRRRKKTQASGTPPKTPPTNPTTPTNPTNPKA
jgi:hypothetical protein